MQKFKVKQFWRISTEQKQKKPPKHTKKELLNLSIKVTWMRMGRSFRTQPSGLLTTKTSFILFSANS